MWLEMNICKTVLVDYLCLKTTLTNSIKVSQKYKVTVLRHCSLDFNMRDIRFVFTKMSLKQLAFYIVPEISLIIEAYNFSLDLKIYAK